MEPPLWQLADPGSVPLCAGSLDPNVRILGFDLIAPNGTYSLVVTNEGAAASENLDDVRLRATFEEAGTGLRLVRNVRLTVCMLSAYRTASTRSALSA
ncbi:MAG: hypothetical protein MJ249_09880 [Kiritimatiellae bacterium]|nr:hypothetical protein [Kiritimatiellia bacterium]